MRLQISDNISIMFTEQGFTYSNWLLIDDDVHAVIDTGLDREGLQDIDPRSIDLVINSHYHIDHTRGNNLFPNAQIAIYKSEIAPLRSKTEYAVRNSLDEWERLMPGVDFISNHREMRFPGSGSIKPLDNGKEIIPLYDGQIIDFGRTKAEVLLTPGHTAGHCCFLFPDQDFIFCSDICLTRAGPWYGEHLADPSEMMRSIDRIIGIKPKRIVSSHIHEVVEDPIPRLAEFKSRIPMREERLWKYVKENPCDIHELAGANLIYRSHPTVFEEFWEKLMLQKHLAHLKQQGLVIQDGDFFTGI